jgi:hypothetical protein
MKIAMKYGCWGIIAQIIKRPDLSIAPLSGLLTETSSALINLLSLQMSDGDAC